MKDTRVQTEETDIESILTRAFLDESEIPSMPQRLHVRVIRCIMWRIFARRVAKTFAAVVILVGFVAFGGILAEVVSDYKALKVRAEGRREMMNTSIRTAVVAMGAVVAGVTAWSDEEVVIDNDLTSSHWNRATAEVIPLPVCWDWEWIPSSAASAEITVMDGSRSVFSANVARTNGDVTTLFELPSTEQMNRYVATISFSDISGNAVGDAVSADLDVLPGSFGKAVVNGFDPTHLKWRRVSDRRFFVPYSSSWHGVFLEAATLTISVGGTVLKTVSLSRSEGLAEIDLSRLGNGPFDVTVDFGEGQCAPLSGTVCFVGDGMVIVFR